MKAAFVFPAAFETPPPGPSYPAAAGGLSPEGDSKWTEDSTSLPVSSGFNPRGVCEKWSSPPPTPSPGAGEEGMECARYRKPRGLSKPQPAPWLSDGQRHEVQGRCSIWTNRHQRGRKMTTNISRVDHTLAAHGWHRAVNGQIINVKPQHHLVEGTIATKRSIQFHDALETGQRSCQGLAAASGPQPVMTPDGVATHPKNLIRD